MNFDLGLAGREAKHTLKSLDSGEDVSNMGTFAPIRQEEAADLSDIDMNYMSGANALEGAAGGDQLNQINRMRDEAVSNRRAQTGRQMVTGLNDLRNWATNTFSAARSERMANERWQQEELARLKGMVYNNQRSGGILPALIQGAASVGGAAITAGGF